MVIYMGSVEKVGVQKRTYKGLRMFDLTPEIKPTVKCTFAVSPSKKFVQKGLLSFDRHEGSYKYNDEVVITVWSKNPPYEEHRADNQGYYRVEIPVPKAVFIKMVEKALEKLWFTEIE